MKHTTKSRTLEEFARATATLANPAIQEWKRQGGKVVGYFCSYFPEEIVTAAGLLPFRMRATGSKATDLADAYMSSINCSFTRHCLDLGLRGEYAFVDGVVWLSSCDHARRIYDNWKRKVNTPFVHIMSLPKKVEKEQVEWYRGEMAILKEALEKHFDVRITDQRLRDAIKLHNETRRLQRQLYELRTRQNPPITGAEVLAVMVASTSMPKREYNGLLRKLLDEVSQQEGNAVYRARLMVLGGILDDPGYIRVIEEQGGLVVTDVLCFGTKIMWKDVPEESDDPLLALARHYIAERPSCARMFGDYPRRADFAKEMVRKFNVDGIIGEKLVFCDLWTVEHYMLEKTFKTLGVPYMTLDREYTPGGVGQIRTRVQAFLEAIRS